MNQDVIFLNIPFTFINQMRLATYQSILNNFLPQYAGIFMINDYPKQYAKALHTVFLHRR